MPLATFLLFQSLEWLRALNFQMAFSNVGKKEGDRRDRQRVNNDNQRDTQKIAREVGSEKQGDRRKGQKGNKDNRRDIQNIPGGRGTGRNKATGEVDSEKTRTTRQIDRNFHGGWRESRRRWERSCLVLSCFVLPSLVLSH